MDVVIVVVWRHVVITYIVHISLNRSFCNFVRYGSRCGWWHYQFSACGNTGSSIQLLCDPYSTCLVWQYYYFLDR